MPKLPVLYNLEAERAILSLILLNNLLIKEVVIEGSGGDKDSGDFFFPEHGKWFSLMSQMIEEGEPVDLVTMCDKLPQDEFTRLSEYASQPHLESHFANYVSTVKEFSNRRKIFRLLGSVLADIEVIKSDEIIGRLNDELSEMSQLVTGRKGGITEFVRGFVESTEGEFSVTNVGQACDKARHVGQSVTNSAVRKALQRLRQEGVIERVGPKDGIYRRIQNDVHFVDISKAEDLQFIDLRWPLGVEDWVRISPKSISIVAGDTDAGKSGMLASFCNLNMDSFPPGKIRYFSSEMTVQRFKNRVANLPRPISDWAKVRFTGDKVSDFHDTLDPDGINIIDYLELDPSKVYDVASYLRKIFDKLKTGIAIVALQKRRGMSLAYGQDWTMMKSELYLTLSRTDDGNIAKIEKGKNWANKRANPVGLKKKFLLVDGIKFFNDPKRPDWFKGEGDKPEDYV